MARPTSLIRESGSIHTTRWGRLLPRRLPARQTPTRPTATPRATSSARCFRLPLSLRRWSMVNVEPYGTARCVLSPLVGSHLSATSSTLTVIEASHLNRHERDDVEREWRGRTVGGPSLSLTRATGVCRSRAHRRGAGVDLLPKAAATPNDALGAQSAVAAAGPRRRPPILAPIRTRDAASEHSWGRLRRSRAITWRAQRSLGAHPSPQVRGPRVGGVCQSARGQAADQHKHEPTPEFIAKWHESG